MYRWLRSRVGDDATAFDLTEVGYSQAEYFISGTATAYTNGGDLASDGRWKVIPGATAAYRTRVLVYRPSNPKNFKGTFKQLPDRAEFASDVNEQLVVELYSK